MTILDFKKHIYNTCNFNINIYKMRFINGGKEIIEGQMMDYALYGTLHLVEI